MTIYIEFFLFQNAIINFCLLRLVYLTTKCKTSLFRLLIATMIGSLFSVISSIFITNYIVMNLLKILCALSMLLTAFKQRKKLLLFNFILLFLYTYAIGGLISSLSSHQLITNFGVITYTKINPNFIYLLAILLTYICEWIARSVGLRIKTNSYIYQITLKHNNKKLSINAYLDTGNMLNLDGKPVIILDLEVYLKLTNITLLDYYLSSSQSISTATITGSSNLRIFSIDEITIKTTKKTIKLSNQLIAVNNADKFKNTNYQALLSPMIL